ncbi:hypothetical protein AB0F25_17345 [Streptomyces wedmorensis]|uniref:hypothetical protein n=1 Tax=Streptomyces wedmorensis TaxID=43759 RepID=UPI00344AEA57
MTVRNTGNVLCTFTGTLDITGGGSARTVPLTPHGDPCDPRRQRHRHRPSGRPPRSRPPHGHRLGDRHGPGGAAKTVDSSTVRLPYFPWLIAALTVGGFLALVLLLVITRKRRCAWLRRRAGERTALRALRRELWAGNPPADDPLEAQAGGTGHP